MSAAQLIRDHAGLVVEPSGAVGVAGLGSARDRFRGQRFATILTGNNIGADEVSEWLGRASP